jgi:hypothetical protein
MSNRIAFFTSLFDLIKRDDLLPEIALIDYLAEEQFMNPSKLEHRECLRQHPKREECIIQPCRYTLFGQSENVFVIARQRG